eukprot:SAG31_NODE_15672_length_743_cov_1.411491_2_plen_65_part_00
MAPPRAGERGDSLYDYVATDSVAAGRTPPGRAAVAALHPPLHWLAQQCPAVRSHQAGTTGIFWQ